jgi:uncharacterized alkaline shock family protein YloU
MDTAGKMTGKTTIAPDVLTSIAKLSTMSVAGVSRLAEVPGGLFNRILGQGDISGVRILVEDNTVYADLYVVLNRDVNVRDVSHQIQETVSRAISEMVGMAIGKINIHVEDIDYSSETGA